MFVGRDYQLELLSSVWAKDSPPLGRFPQFSAFDEVGDPLTEHWGRKQQKPTKVGLFPFKPLAVALLCLSATVNKIHLVP